MAPLITLSLIYIILGSGNLAVVAKTQLQLLQLLHSIFIFLALFFALSDLFHPHDRAAMSKDMRGLTNFISDIRACALERRKRDFYSYVKA